MKMMNIRWKYYNIFSQQSQLTIISFSSINTLILQFTDKLIFLKVFYKIKHTINIFIKYSYSFYINRIKKMNNNIQK